MHWTHCRVLCCFPSGLFGFDKVNPFLFLFDCLRSRITKQRYVVHKDFFSQKIHSIGHCRKIVSGALSASLKQAKWLLQLMSQTKLCPILLKLRACSWGFLEGCSYWQKYLFRIIKYEPPGGSEGMPPPPRIFWNLEAWKCYFQHCARQYFKLDGV